MCHEEHHRVLTDIIHHWHARHLDVQQHATDATKRANRACHDAPHVAIPLVVRHLIFSMMVDVHIHEHCHEHQRHSDAHRVVQAIQQPFPHASEEEEENAKEHVVQTEPQRVAHRVEPIAHEWKRQHNPAQSSHFLQEMHADIGNEEREKEPARDIAIERARVPDMLPANFLHHRILLVEDEPRKEEVNGVADSAPHEVGNHQALELVLAVFPRLSAHRLVEIACLEEEERHEEIRPPHNRGPPFLRLKTARTRDVQHNHPYDANAA